MSDVVTTTKVPSMTSMTDVEDVMDMEVTVDLHRLRDLARLGLAYQQGGVARDQQVIPADWVADTAAGGEGSARAYAACETMSAEDRAGWDCYRNAFWIAEPGETYSGIGMLGQACYIDRPSGVVIARFSSYPLDQRSALGRETFRSFHAITEALT